MTCGRVAVIRGTPPLAPASNTNVEGSWAKFKRAHSVSLAANSGGVARVPCALETSARVQRTERSGRSWGTAVPRPRAAERPCRPRAFAPRSWVENREAADETLYT